MKKFLTPFLCGIVLAGFLTGCRSDVYYQNRAAERAREFLLDNARELTPEEVNYVRFHDPILLTGEKLGKFAFGNDYRSISSEGQQICIAWQLPGRDYCYLVYGFSEPRMAFWYPNRILRKKFQLKSSVFSGILETARSYAGNYLYHDMTPTEYNLMLYTFPYVYETNFALSADPEMKLTGEKLEQAKEKLQKSKQYSIVWCDPQSDSCIVICGTAADDTLMGWNVNFGGKLTNSELKSKSLRTLRTPETPDRPTGDESQIRRELLANPNGLPPQDQEN